MAITTWNFKADDPAIRHLGPMAQDFYQAFGLGADERHIAPLDVSSVAVAAIQGLNEKLEQKDKQISTLEKKVERLEQLIAHLVPVGR